MNKQDFKNIRIQAGLTQAQLAKLFRLSSQNYISKIESGEKRPSKQTEVLYELLENGLIKPAHYASLKRHFVKHNKGYT